MSESTGVTLFLHGRVHADAGSAPAAGAHGADGGLAVAGGRVLAVGPAADLREAFPRAHRVDLGGRPVFPGLVDAHVHLVACGLRLLHVELRGTRSIADAVRRLADAAARLPPDAWVLGRGWDKNIWVEDRFPTRADLDPLLPDRPVACTSKDGHLLWVNTAALRRAGITRETPDPPGGAIGRGPDGAPDGLLKEEAGRLVRRAMPPPSAAMREAAIRVATAEFHRLGLTGVHAFTGGGDEGAEQFAALQVLWARGDLALRTVATIPDHLLDAVVAAGLRTGFGDPLLRLGPVKIFADGTLGSQTAWMLEPFEGQPQNTGIVVRTPDELDALVRRAVAAGVATATHAIGDGAIRAVLDVLERHAVASARAGVRHRIEHVQLLHRDDLPRLGRLGVVASMQPIHATADRDVAERYWGSRARWAYAWQSLLQTGAVLAFGSDAPVETPDPWRGLFAAVTRRREDEPGASPWVPDECLTLEQALRAYTQGAAYAAGAERDWGRLAPGCVADFIVLDRDPYGSAPDDLLRVQVLATVVDGRVRYAAGPLAGLEGAPGAGAGAATRGGGDL
ncbi:MAG: amidohydrolase [Armatimonadota bacterium]|nr:amidohydrolase [Armatimonadota bacterium]MDR7533282.1 amidohydrolase [Armatimonadota bacterium]MDR7536925.1 amidohydrolase [Armatimonadota bacterium]